MFNDQYTIINLLRSLRFRIFAGKSTQVLEIKNITILGSGRVASHLGPVLKAAGFHIHQVYSRNSFHAKVLADKLSTGYTDNLEEINPDADLYVFAITDDSLLKISEILNLGEKLSVHTSGALPLQVLRATSSNIGVFYPLQTFSLDRPVDFANIPICLEANSERNLEGLRSVAGKISGDVREVSSDRRKILHLAAVFACNFPNYLYSVSESLLNRAGMNFDIVKEVVKETAAKVQDMSPSEAQTGPAVRGDQKVINQHLELLTNEEKLQKLYILISDLIHEKKNLKS